MQSRCFIVSAGLLIAGIAPSLCTADDAIPSNDCLPHASGKVCKLVCETKKLTTFCYACECTDLCIPGPSRPGCKHCETCCNYDACGECKPPCNDCEYTPACEFCWRDWFACGCAKPRTVKVLTKYQAEKEIGWYHWEVVDAECCDCVAQIGENGDIATKASDGCLYKPAPADATLGEVLAVTKDELSDLESVLNPTQEIAEEPEQSEVAVVEQADPQPEDAAMPSETEPEVSIAERLGRLFR